MAIAAVRRLGSSATVTAELRVAAFPKMPSSEAYGHSCGRKIGIFRYGDCGTTRSGISKNAEFQSLWPIAAVGRLGSSATAAA